MTTSILLTIKKMLGISEEYKAFDLDIVININSVFLTLEQLGVGPSPAFQITGDEESWTDYLGSDLSNYPGIQSYVYLRVRLLFDPPTASYLVDAMQKQCAEFEWRLNLQKERRMEDDVETESPSEPPEDRRSARQRTPGEARLLSASWHKRTEVGS